MCKTFNLKEEQEVRSENSTEKKTVTDLICLLSVGGKHCLHFIQ